MMVLVRFIDVFVIFCKILGGRGYGNPFTRVLAWLVVVSVALFAVGLVAFAVAHIPDLVDELNS
ncbi:hypothetical protein [Aldersonia kunmingensis]|uniref:hypothetical protein n=1 Tax=Aldersonia kunmingensis TaxID=408066 RepID=UPI00083130FA|nr:hypothetical protein [Aldersonia kunmingensis]